MANGSGVSVSAVGKRWRVRWRETDADEKTTQRERTVPTLAVAQQLAGEIVEALKLRGHYVDPRAPVAPAVATLDDVGKGWVNARRARGRSANTIRNDIGNVARILAAVRRVEGIADERPVPASVLSRDLVIKATGAMQGPMGFGASTVAHAIGAMLDLWTWSSDDARTYPGVPTPPRHLAGLRPEVPRSVACPAPTMAELDAVVRVLASTKNAGTLALPAAVIMRWTGLRVSQVLGIEVADVNLTACTLVVRVGKSAAERADRRTVPMAAGLRDWLVELHGEAVTAGRRTLIRTIGERAHPPAKALHAAWKAATDAGDVRRETWAPSTRELARPDHAFRAGFQHALVLAGVSESTIDALVGHRGSLRDQHYVDASARFEAMRAAVATLPPIDWRTAVPSNVVPLPSRA